MAVGFRVHHFVVTALLSTLVVGCSRDFTRPFVPKEANKPPQATILEPAPNSAFATTLRAPVTIAWTGSDPEGNLLEYRYRLFETTNPDFPNAVDFLAYLYAHPDTVLSAYAPDFDGWERLDPRKASEIAVTYRTLTPQRYAFVVVAVDQRGGHDVALSKASNMLDFLVEAPQPGMKFFGDFGEITIPWIQPQPPQLPRIEATGSEVTVHWVATPPPGETIAGYRWAFDLNQMSGTPTLDNTSATIPRPAEGTDTLFFLEVELGSGMRSLISVHVTWVMS